MVLKRQICMGGKRRRGLVVALVVLAACGARQGATNTVMASRVAVQAELDALKQALTERDRMLNQLEGRLALLEAEQRQLRYAVAHAESSMGIRETVRIGAGGAHEQGERLPPSFAEPRPPRSEDRPLLRLVGEHSRDASEPMMPVPVVSERLPLAPLPAVTPPMDLPVALDATSHYRQALDLVRQRKFDAALSSLTEFLARHGSDSRAPRAMFWRGEVLFAQRDYARALQAFESSLARDPTGDKAAEALLKVGLCHRRLGAPDLARNAIERLKSQFPQSDAARRAAQEDA